MWSAAVTAALGRGSKVLWGIRDPASTQRDHGVSSERFVLKPAHSFQLSDCFHLYNVVAASYA